MSKNSSSTSLSSDDEYYGDNGEEFRGAILNNKYALIDKIGYGSYSSVWLAYCINDDKYYAIKIQNNEDYDEGLIELKILRKINELRNNNLIKLIEGFEITKKNIKKKKKKKIKKGKRIILKKNVEIKKFICMVIPLMAGSVYSLIREGKYKNGLDNKLLKLCINTILYSMDDMHNKLRICHTDLKPENMLISGRSVKVNELIDEYNKINLKDIYNLKLKKELETKKFNIMNINNNKKIKILKSKILKQCHKDILENMISLNISESEDDKSEIFNESANNSDSDNDNNNSESDDDNNNSDLDDDKNNSESDDDNNNSESDDDKNNSESDESVTTSENIRNEDYSVIENKYLENCNIVLTDFGSNIKISDLVNEEIQTRYYRAPEIILGLHYTEKIDIWSIGCLLYEIYTGKILFDPEKDKDFSRDFHHLFLIQEICGKIPNNMIRKSPRKNEFFKKNKFNCDKVIKNISLESIINKKNNDYNIVSIIKKCLTIDPTERPNIQDLKNIFTNFIKI